MCVRACMKTVFILVNSTDLMFNPLYTGNPYMDTLANSEDPDKMHHNASFHQGCCCLLILKQWFHSVERITYG